MAGDLRNLARYCKEWFWKQTAVTTHHIWKHPSPHMETAQLVLVWQLDGSIGYSVLVDTWKVTMNIDLLSPPPCRECFMSFNSKRLSFNSEGRYMMRVSIFVRHPTYAHSPCSWTGIDKRNSSFNTHARCMPTRTAYEKIRKHARWLAVPRDNLISMAKCRHVLMDSLETSIGEYHFPELPALWSKLHW